MKINGLVQLKCTKTGKTRGVWPIDAKELVKSGEFEYMDVEVMKMAKASEEPKVPPIKTDANGRVTLIHASGEQKNVFPVDARELMNMDKGWRIFDGSITSVPIDGGTVVLSPQAEDVVKKEVEVSAPIEFSDNDVEEKKAQTRGRRARK